MFNNKVANDRTLIRISFDCHFRLRQHPLVPCTIRIVLMLSWTQTQQTVFTIYTQSAAHQQPRGVT